MREPEPVQAESPREVLWWLTLQQARPLFWMLGGGFFAIGLLVPSNSQFLWPLATLLLGVACGTAAFAEEQRDLSFQFLSSQHFPLQTIWRSKILFWLTAAILLAFVMLLGGLVVSGGRAFFNPRVAFPPSFDGTLRDLMGPTLFFGVWLVYGFGAGQLFVMLCRKNMLALLVSFLVAGTALGLWLPSVLCGGMSGWQLWAAPLIVLLATWSLMRAWSSGRIMERRPLAALVGLGAAMVIWALVNFGYRSWECPDVGEPIDTAAFRASFPAEKDNAAAKAIHRAVTQFDEARAGPKFQDEPWLASIAKASRLPVGVLEVPRADGQMPTLKHLPTCRKMSDALLRMAGVEQPGPAFEHLAQVLALSRQPAEQGAGRIVPGRRPDRGRRPARPSPMARSPQTAAGTVAPRPGRAQPPCVRNAAARGLPAHGMLSLGRGSRQCEHLESGDRCGGSRPGALDRGEHHPVL